MGSVVLKKLEKNYASEGRPPAVCGIDLEVRAGEFMVLVGPSGCGKSTTLRMIAGLEEATRGSIEIDGREVTHVPARDRDIAMVFQNYALYPHMTVRENMAFGLKMRGIDRKEIARRVDDAARLLGLDGVLERRPRELSGGQRQRVALGRAIVRQPKVFLFDEPLSNLDAKMRVATRLELARLHRRLGATMIYVTHDQVEAMTLGDRVCVMDAGRIKQVDTPLEVYRRPANLFVAGFIGSPAMNLWSGTAEPAGSGSVFRGPGGLRVPLGVHGLPADVTLGVRPEAVRLSSTEGVFEGVVEAVEATGAETFVTLEAGGATVVVRCGPDAPWRGGDRARVSFDEPGIHLFDTNSGRRLG